MQATITHISQLDLNKKYSYAEYLTWRFEEMVELIKGRIWRMSPAPRTVHQKISWNFTGVFFQFMKNHKCQAFAAPFDVRILDKKKSKKENKDVFTVVQPDLCVICDEEKIDELGCVGAPDLIIEILSPGNSKKEMRVKYELYEEAGVMEYWVVDPERQTVQVFALDANEKYQTMKIFISEDVMTSHIFKDLKIDLTEVFTEMN